MGGRGTIWGGGGLYGGEGDYMGGRGTIWGGGGLYVQEEEVRIYEN